MHLVDDVHTIFQPGRRIGDLVADGAHRVHAVVGRRVHFQHVSRALTFDRAACRAFAARIAVFGGQAVDRFCQDLCAGRLTRAARTAEEVRMRDAVLCRLILQDLGDVLLPADIVKCSGTPFSIQSLIH